MNKYFSYDNMELWDDACWKDRYSCIIELARWIEIYNQEHNKLPAGSLPDGRDDGYYDSKTRSIVYDDVKAKWLSKGLHYHASEMGGVRWVAMIPDCVVNGTNTDPKILLQLKNVDASDLKWNMSLIAGNEAVYEAAAKEDTLVVMVVEHDDVYGTPSYSGVLQELSVIYKMDMNHVYLDISTVQEAEKKLSEVPGFVYKDVAGKPIDPDGCIESLLPMGIPVLEISDRWSSKVAGLLKSVKSNEYQYDKNKIIFSETGKIIADGMKNELIYDSAEDPKFLESLEKRGVVYATHKMNGYTWVTVVPKCALDDPEKKLPVIMLFQETITGFQRLSGLCSYDGWVDIVSQGECMMIIFALESADENDIMWDMLQEAKTLYPVDESRVYVTGHSHNGHFCMEFARRHHAYIAGTAPLGMSPGMLAPAYTHEVVPVTDEMIEEMRQYDLPTINICGSRENEMLGLNKETHFFQTEDNAADAMARRLRAYRCSERSKEELKNAKHSTHPVIGRTGIPADHSDIRVIYGQECLISDFINEDGNHFFRNVTLSGFVHMAAPQMPVLVWDYLRRFKRDISTGNIITMY